MGNFTSLLAEKDARLAEKMGNSASLLAEKDARLAEKDAHFRALLAEKLASARVLAEYHAQRERTHALALAVAKYELDLALDRVGVRAITEAMVGELQQLCGDGPSAKPRGISAALEVLLRAGGGCPSLAAYLRVAAEDNGLSTDGVVESARLLYSSLSTHLHTQSLGGRTLLAADALANSNTLLAFAALASFTGRHYSFYLKQDRGALAPRLRVPLGCGSTMDALRAQPFRGAQLEPLSSGARAMPGALGGPFAPLFPHAAAGASGAENFLPQ